MNDFRQIRRGTSGNRLRNVTTGQPLHRGGYRLNTLLNCTPRAVILAPELKTHRYIVSYIRDWKTHNKATSITLKGSWLNDAGFETGMPLKVRVMPGCLVLIAQAPEPEPELMQALKKVCKLSVREQQQVTEVTKVTELIEVISKPQR